MAEFSQGCVDRSYIQLAPDRGGLVETAGPVDRAINWAPFQYMNVEVRGRDPFDIARAHRLGQPVENYSRYLPRRDMVMRPLV
jgi:hypothetical protein